jgi:putative transposase
MLTRFVRQEILEAKGFPVEPHQRVPLYPTADAAEVSRRCVRRIKNGPLHRPVGSSSAVTSCGRICYNWQKVNFSTVFAGQKVGIKQIDDHVWLVSFMHYDIGFFDDETCRLEPAPNPFGAKVLNMSPE